MNSSVLVIIMNPIFIEWFLKLLFFIPFFYVQYFLHKHKHKVDIVFVLFCLTWTLTSFLLFSNKLRTGCYAEPCLQQLEVGLQSQVSGVFESETLSKWWSIWCHLVVQVGWCDPLRMCMHILHHPSLWHFLLTGIQLILTFWKMFWKSLWKRWKCSSRLLKEEKCNTLQKSPLPALVSKSDSWHFPRMSKMQSDRVVDLRGRFLYTFLFQLSPITPSEYFPCSFLGRTEDKQL